MTNDTNLERFVDAQQADYNAALTEIKNGQKQTHWMWYIFPQIEGLGFSQTSRFYAIKGIREASAYLAHPILGRRLVEICKALLKLESDNANQIFGSPDDLKLRSSMTLFSTIPGADPVFHEVLNKFFNGKKDAKTLQILQIPAK